MDAETRHALKQTELAEALEHASDWTRSPTFRNVVLGVVLVVVAFFAYRYWSASARGAANAAWAEVYAAQRSAGESPDTALDSLSATIAATKDPNLAAAARLISANILMNRTLEDPALITANGPQILDLLQPVTSDASLAAQYRAPAKFLTARVQESVDDLAAARATYQAIADESAFAGTPYPKLAKDRLNLLEGLAKLPVLTPGSPPTPEPTPQPGWEPLGADEINPPTEVPVGPSSPAAPPATAPPTTDEPSTDEPAADAPSADEPAAAPTEPTQP